MVDPLSSSDDRWLLPEGIEELLPDQAEYLERLRRELLDLFSSWGYRLVVPPFVEYLESLLVGTGRDLDLQTFKLTDQLTGRLLGVRADMTPQVARIDAHRIKSDLPTRLCYIGTVLHTKPEGFARTRSPLQVGAELYGHAGIESDVEILQLMVETLTAMGIKGMHLDLGHVGVFRGLAREAKLTAVQEDFLFDALQRKARAEISAFVSGLGINKALQDMLIGLVDLNGGEEVLDEASSRLQAAGGEVKAALTNLSAIAALAQDRMPGMHLHFDLAELRGYHYQTGVVFSAFAPGHGQEIARGGRYDDVGRAFGRARPATGFSTDLETLILLCPPTTKRACGVLAPCSSDPALRTLVQDLRAKGVRVCYELPGQTGSAREMDCDRVLRLINGEWIIQKV